MGKLLSTLKNSLKYVRRHEARLAAALGLIGVTYLIVEELSRDPADQSGLTTATLILIVLAALLLFLLVAPGSMRDLFQRMANLKVAGVLEVGLQTVARAEILQPPAIGDEQDPPERNGEKLRDIVKKVESKLRFLHVIIHMHADPRPIRSERQIARWLEMEDLLTADEAQFALDLISKRELGIEALAEQEREELLDAAWAFAVRFSFTVWDRYVRRQLQNDGWVVADFPQTRDHQPDFLAHRDGRWAVMATKVGEKGGYSYVTTRNRLENMRQKVSLAGWCIVFPGGDRKATVISEDGASGRDSKVKVLDLEHLLGTPDRAFADNSWNDDYQQPDHTVTAEPASSPA
jgi:hypothetical protein